MAPGLGQQHHDDRLCGRPHRRRISGIGQSGQYLHNEKTLEFLGRWTRQDDGTVRQNFEQFDEEKGEMVPIFTGIYHPKP